MKKLIVISLLIMALGAGGCASQGVNGAGVGALGGGAIGALVSKNKLLGAAIGAGGGALLGYIVGNEVDKSHLRAALEKGQSGVPMSWQSPDGKQVTATPQRPIQDYNTGLIYRDIIIQTQGGETVRAKAYRDTNGEWVLVQ